MAPQTLIKCDWSLFIVIDMQVRLLPVIANAERILAKTVLLLKAARQIGIPILASEHYSEGIGHTHPRVASLLPPDSIIEKIHFSCLADEVCRHRIAEPGRSQVILVGTEAHVCVLQTALELKQAGYDVFVVGDAVGSRLDDDRSLAIMRMHSARITVVSTEMVVFEWMQRANTPLFRDMLVLIKQCGEES